MASITDLPRNDVKAAVGFLEQALDAGTFSTDDGQTLAMLQDDPDDLAAAVAKMVDERTKRGAPVGPFVAA